MVLFELHLSRSRPGKAHIFKNECFGQITFFNPSLTPQFQYKIQKILVKGYSINFEGWLFVMDQNQHCWAVKKIPKRLLGKNIGDDKWSANDGMTSSTFFFSSRFSLKNNQDFMVHVKLPSFSLVSLNGSMLTCPKTNSKSKGSKPQKWQPINFFRVTSRFRIFTHLDSTKTEIHHSTRGNRPRIFQLLGDCNQWPNGLVHT